MLRRNFLRCALVSLPPAPFDAAMKAGRNSRSMYLDYQATTPMDPRVLDAMLPLLTERFGNPHSRTHMFGWDAEAAVESARERVASLVGASSKEIFFTSGATESNNIAIKGVAQFYGSDKKNHVITLQTEHKCVLDSCRALERNGFEVTYLGVNRNGLVDLDVLRQAIRPTTALVSVMYVHNEIGVVQNIKEIGRICHEGGTLLHTDGAQAVGKIPIDVERDNIDLMSMSGHKIYGPKGVGALYMRRRPRVRILSPVSGGGQERGVRSGTLPSPLVVGFGAACDIASREMSRDIEHVSKLSKMFWTSLSTKLPFLVLNGDATQRYPGNLNISFTGVEGESLLMGIDNVAVSSGSACTSASLEPSYVLRALGVDAENAHTSLRFGIGRFTTEDEVQTTADMLVKEVERLRDMSPLWELFLEGKGKEEVDWR